MMPFAPEPKVQYGTYVPRMAWFICTWRLKGAHDMVLTLDLLESVILRRQGIGTTLPILLTGWRMHNALLKVGNHETAFPSKVIRGMNSRLGVCAQTPY